MEKPLNNRFANCDRWGTIAMRHSGFDGRETIANRYTLFSYMEKQFIVNL